MSPSGFRNLSGLGKPPIAQGYAVWSLHLSGPTQQRAIADFPTAKLPVQVSAVYELNGKKMKAKNIVGKTGELKVTYVLKNTTTQSTKVTFTNVVGDRETATVKAPVPIGASVSVTIPADFTNIKTPGATANGNGNGTSSAAWTLLLFNPLGGVKQSVTYQAHVTNAVVPSASVAAEVLPSATIKPLPQIKIPGAPAVPTVTLGARLASLQAALQGALAKLAADASSVVSSLKAVAVRAAQGISTGAKKVAGVLLTLSAAAKTLSTNDLQAARGLAAASKSVAGDATRVGPAVQAGINQAAAGAAAASARMGALQTGVSQAATRSANAATGLGQIEGVLTETATEAADAARRMAAIQLKLNQDASTAADAASQMNSIRAGLDALPPAVHGTPAYRALHAKVVELEALLSAHALRLKAAALEARVLEARLTVHAARLQRGALKARVLAGGATALSGLLKTTVPKAGALGLRLTHVSGVLAATAPKAKVLLGVRLTALSSLLARLSTAAANVIAPDALKASTTLTGLVPQANSVSTQAAQAATNLSTATRSRSSRQSKTIQPRQVGGGAILDSAVGKLDAAINQAATKVDNAYAYLTALNQRAANNKLPAGNAKGATAQVGAFVYSVSGANNSSHQNKLAALIAEIALLIGLPLGIAFYRIRRGMPSSLKPPKSAPAASKG